MSKKIYFYYPKGERLTGQELASKMIVDLLDNDWNLKLYEIPAFERSSKKSFYRFLYFMRVLKIWCSFPKMLFIRQPAVYMNMGQALGSLLRDGIPLMILSWFKWDMRCVISLHGHVFTQWKEKTLTSRLFVKVLKKADFITVLGEVQKNKLAEMGIDNDKIIIVNNTCEVEAYKKRERKLNEVNLLYLSNLIKSKGYCEYLESLGILAKQTSEVNFKAVLCGQVTLSGTSDSDETIEKSTKWINNKIASINKSSHVKVEWINGAYGDDKRKLFEQTDIFVFPSRYTVEAQPLVLLEAMAMGCAIITSRVGEIPSTVSESCATLLADPTPKVIAEAIQDMQKNGLENYISMGLQRYETMFSRQIYQQKWQHVFTKISSTDESSG